MLIKDLFRYEIERYINPVVKVEEDDNDIAKQELKEYVITDQLRGHFEKCLDKYLNDKNKVGYWISGWFGSGKSHFLKIFGYLLENHKFDDCTAAEMFLRRDETNKLKPYVDEISQKYKTTVVMFDVLEEAVKLEGKVEPIEQTIYRQWLKKRGFYTGKLWVARMEKELYESDKYDEFIKTVESISGRNWDDVRKTRIGQNYIQRALAKVLPDQIPTESIAKDYIEDLKKEDGISASILTDELLKYVNDLDGENGCNNRLFIIIDEIGQYIAANPDVIGYLQAIETTFARKGKGKLWIAVSSQNRLEQLTDQYIKSEDNRNKVIDRFEVRIHLTPENLDEVINERVLKKKAEGINAVSKLYEANKGKLLPVLEFKDAKKYLPKASKGDFINSYPFLPYQIQLMQPIYYSVISKSNANKKLGGTNRSMIKAAQGILVDKELDVKDRETGELVTLDMFFEQAKEFIDDQILVSVREAGELDPVKGGFLSKILKVLYLLNNDDKLPKNVETIAKLLIPNINSDFAQIQAEVQDCLDILFKHGYVEKDAYGSYKFISPEVQSFRQEAISRTNEIGIRERIKQIKTAIDSIFNNAITKINYKNIRPFDVQITIDDEVRSSKGLIILNLNSVMQSTDKQRKQQHLMKSIGDNYNIYWYAKYDSTIDEDIWQYLITDKIIKEYRVKWGSDEDKSYFLRKEEEKNNKLYEDTVDKITNSFKNGIYIYQGREYPVPDKKDIKSIFEDIVSIAVPHVYYRFEMSGVKVNKEDIQSVFTNNQMSIDLNKLNLISDTNVNAGSAVLNEVLNEAKRLKNKNGQCVGKDLLDVFDSEPYGWASEAVRLFAALLFRNGNIELNYEGKDFLDYNKAGVRDIFEVESNFKRAVFKPAVVVDAATRQMCQDILKDKFNQPSDDTIAELYTHTTDKLIEYRNSLSAMKQVIKNNDLPLGDEIQKLDGIFDDILKSRTQGDTINNFVKKLPDYEELLAKYKKLKEFNKNNIEEYQKIKSFLSDIWPIDVDNNSDDYGEKKKIYDQIINDLKSGSFIDVWLNIRENYHKLYDPYVKKYIEVHQNLYNLYSSRIADMQNNKSFIILKSETAKGDIISTLSNKICSSKVDQFEIPCKKCKSFIRDMKILIDAVDIYNKKAMEKLYIYLNKQLEDENNRQGGSISGTIKPQMRHVSVSSFPKGIMINNTKDVKQYLKRVEEKLMKEIENGDSIIIE